MMALGEARQSVSEPSLWVDAVQFGGLDERGDDRPVVSAIIGSCEERVLAVERQWPDAALDGVGVQLDTSVAEEAAEAVPVAQCIADSLGEPTFAADLAEPHIEHAPKVVDDDAAAFLPDGTAFIGRLTTDVGLNGIELRDAREHVGCAPNWHRKTACPIARLSRASIASFIAP
jgi:hypothetical protein